MILGQRVRLRPVEKDDVPRFVKWLADEETRSLLSQHLPFSLMQEERWYEDNLNAREEQAWAIDAQPEGAGLEPWEHIGSCGFFRLNWRCRHAEAGILIGAREHWGEGYGSDALRTLVHWGFYTLNLNRIYLRVFEDNRRAIRCYQKVGFTEEGRLRQDDYRDGAYRDTLLMSMLRLEWDNQAAAAEAGEAADLPPAAELQPADEAEPTAEAN
jgi:RimJ/RimL family protein N-acetyltransferase